MVRGETAKGARAMKAIMRWMVGIVGAILVVGTVAVPRAWASPSFVYLQGGGAEYGTTTPCVANAASPGTNGQPYTVADCTTTSADTVYFHFNVPNDYSAANSASYLYVQVEYMPETDNTSGRTTCWQTSITAWPVSYGSQNYRTTSLGALGSGTNILEQTWGQYNPTDTVIAVPENIIDAHTGVACNSPTCQGAQATLKLKRTGAACGGTDVTGAVGILSVTIRYSN